MARQADDLAGELFNVELSRLEQERAKAIEKEETLLAHLAELKAQRFYQVEIPAEPDPAEPGKTSDPLEQKRAFGSASSPNTARPSIAWSA